MNGHMRTCHCSKPHTLGDRARNIAGHFVQSSQHGFLNSSRSTSRNLLQNAITSTICLRHPYATRGGLSPQTILKKTLTLPMHMRCTVPRPCSTMVGLEGTADSEIVLKRFTVEEALSSLGFGPFHVSLLAYAGLAWAAEAMELLLLSFVGPAAAAEWALGPQWESAVSSVVFVGMMVGAYAWGLLADARGRRFAFATTAALTFLAGVASAAAPSFPLLLLLRAAVGVGLGGAPVVFSLFLEFIPARDRGFWSIALSAFWTVGSVAEAALAWAVMPALGWRWLVALSSAPLALLLLFYPLLPESPRFLLVQNRPDEALQVLKRVAMANQRMLPDGTLSIASSCDEGGSDANESAAGVQASAACTVIGTAIDGAGDSNVSCGMDERNEQLPSTTWKVASTSPERLSVLSNFETQQLLPRPVGSQHATSPTAFAILQRLLQPPYRTFTLLLWLVFFANAFTYYGLVLLTSQLPGTLCPLVASAAAAANPAEPAVQATSLYSDIFITSAAEFPGLLLAALMADRVGRKTTISLFLFASSTAILFLLISIVTPLASLLDDANRSVAFLACLFLGRASIMGAFQTVFIYAPEVYPTPIRSSGLGIANSFSRLGGILCPFVAVNLVQRCELVTALTLLTLAPFLAAVATLSFPVETSGRALSDAETTL